MRTGVRRGLTAALVLLALLPRLRSAQARTDDESPGGGFSLASLSWDGLGEFTKALTERGGPERVRPRGTLDYSELRPSDAIWVLAPTQPLQVDDLTRFLAAGGRVAVADDFGTSAALLARFGIRRVPPPPPALRVNDNPRLAIATPVSQMVAGVERGRHPMTRDVDWVVTNHPMALEHPQLTPLLEIESSAGGPPAALAVSGVIAGRGRLFVLGDPSLFINLMLRYPGNRALALGLADSLLAPDGAPPGRLWIVSGDFEQTGSFGERSWLDELRMRLEELERTATRIEHEGLPSWLWWALGGCLWLALGRYLVGQLRAPALARPLYARLAPLVTQSGPQARVAWLSAPTTNPLLGLLELGAALEERLSPQGRALPEAGGPPLERALAELGLDPAQIRRAARALETLRRLRAGLALPRPPRPSAREAKRIHREAMEIVEWLEALEASERRPTNEESPRS